MARSTGLRTEILLTLTLLLGAALILGGVFFSRLTEQSLFEERISQLETVSATLAGLLADYPGKESLEERQRVIVDFFNYSPTKLSSTSWRLYGHNLELLAANLMGGPELSSLALRQQAKLTGQASRLIIFPTLLESFSQKESSVVFIKPIFSRKQFQGLLEIRFSLDDIRYLTFRVQKIILLYVLLYAVVLISLGYYLLQRNIIRPAQNLLHATGEVEKGNLDVKLPVAGPVEISRLAEAYNRMVGALAQSYQETQQHIVDLENTNVELQETRDQLIRNEKLASVGHLAAGLAHELGNPLAALTGYLEILKTRIKKEENRDILARSIVEVQRIDYLVRELLDFSRPTSDDLEEIDPVQELRKTVELLTHQGAMKQVKVVDYLPDRFALTKIDRSKIQQVFINLLLNAKHACDETGRIELSGRVEGENLFLTISDDGCGISEKNIGHIFDPFYTTKEPGEGTGLGLAICQRIIDEVGGDISVRSMVGVGSEFSLKFKKSSERGSEEKGTLICTER